MKTYLDYNATVPLRPEVITVMQELLALPLNPSSVHIHGRKAKSLVEDARRVIGETIGAFANEVVFTASGTEANNWALHAFADHIPIVSAIEHSSVLKTAEKSQGCLIIPVTIDGVIDIPALEKLVPAQGKFIVCVMLANNETGVTQPVAEIARLVHAKGGLMHCDAVQAFGKIPVDFTALGCDLLTLSAHKMGGPVGAAALVVKNNLTIVPMLTGGAQELKRRAGTENVAAIAGFSKAAELIDFAHMKQVERWRDTLESELKKVAPQSVIAGQKAERLPNTSCISMPGTAAETQLINFDLAGVCVSAGSACSSGRVERSHVLSSMGLSDAEAGAAVRVSAGWASKGADFSNFSGVWKQLFKLKNAA